MKKNLLEKYKENASKHVQELTNKNSETLFAENTVMHEGYLFKKSTNVISAWSKCYCTIDNGFFCFYKKDKFKDTKKLNLLLCSVRAAPQDDRRFCFELISPNKVNIHFQKKKNLKKKKDSFIPSRNTRRIRKMDLVY